MFGSFINTNLEWHHFHRPCASCGNRVSRLALHMPTLVCLFILYVNEHDFASPWLCEQLYFDCICWFLSRQLTVFIQSNIVLNQWKSIPEARSIRVSLNQGTANWKKYCLLYSSGEIPKSVAKSLLRINKHAIANVFLYLCFQLRIMYVKNRYL